MRASYPLASQGPIILTSCLVNCCLILRSLYVLHTSFHPAVKFNSSVTKMKPHVLSAMFISHRYQAQLSCGQTYSKTWLYVVCPLTYFAPRFLFPRRVWPLSLTPFVVRSGTGAGSRFPNFTQRLQEELEDRLESARKVQILVPPNQRDLVWMGGSILASLYPNPSWITRKEYNEAGPAAVHRKCFWYECAPNTNNHTCTYVCVWMTTIKVNFSENRHYIIVKHNLINSWIFLSKVPQKKWIR